MFLKPEWNAAFSFCKANHSRSAIEDVPPCQARKQTERSRPPQGHPPFYLGGLLWRITNPDCPTPPNYHRMCRTAHLRLSTKSTNPNIIDREGAKNVPSSSLGAVGVLNQVTGMPRRGAPGRRAGDGVRGRGRWRSPAPPVDSEGVPRGAYGKRRST